MRIVVVHHDGGELAYEVSSVVFEEEEVRVSLDRGQIVVSELEDDPPVLPILLRGR